jgi:hypothetical protein
VDAAQWAKAKSAKSTDPAAHIAVGRANTLTAATVMRERIPHAT